MEDNKQEQLAIQQEMLRDLQTQLSQASSEDEKRSIQLRMNVINAKIAQLQNETSTDNETISESLPANYSKSKLSQEILNATKSIRDICNRIDKYAKSSIDKYSLNNIAGDFGAIGNFAKMISNNSKELAGYAAKGTLTEDTIKQDGKWVNKGKEGTHGVFDTKKAADDQRKAMFASGYTEDAPYQKTHFLDTDNDGNTIMGEGCMTKKFENMTNREIANYIFGHPHTKFAGKMKECDDKEILKAIRDIKRTNEEAPVTNTTAVANTESPSMYMKRKLNK